jgi:hypothetical protein
VSYAFTLKGFHSYSAGFPTLRKLIPNVILPCLQSEVSSRRVERVIYLNSIRNVHRIWGLG